MSILAALLVCVAALHLSTALFVAMHRARRDVATDFLPLAGICFSQAVSSVGSALVTDATHFSDAVTGQQLQLIGATLALASFSFLAVGAPARLIRLWAVVTMIAVVSGLCFEDAPRTVRTLGFAWAPDYREARFSTLGIVLTWIVFPVALAAMRHVHRAQPMPVSRLELGLSLLLGTLAFWNDTLVRFGPLRSIYLTEIVTLLMALSSNRRLRHQFQATTDELLVRTAELELSTLELAQMQAQILRRQQLAAVGEFSAVIAHEVRNPLAIIKNAVSALRRGESNAHQPELLSILDEEVTRLQRLVSDLSTYTRPLVPALVATRLEPLVQQVIARTRTANEALSRIAVRVSVHDDASEVLGDPSLIEMAFANVLANAAQATGDGGTITVEAQRYDDNGRGVELRVTDTGTGMTPDVVEKAREPFFTTRSTGTGLGLAIVDRVMRAHNGQFGIRSTERGTCITLRFPTDPEDVDTVSAA